MSTPKALEAHIGTALETLQDEVKKWISSINEEIYHGLLLLDLSAEVSFGIIQICSDF
jgi:hypothetical protein